MFQRVVQQRDRLPLQLPDGRRITLLRVYDPRARRLRLRVSERGVRLTIPAGASEDDVTDFLSRHAAWVADHLEAEPASSAPVLHPNASSHLPLRGQHLPVQWQVSDWLQIRHTPEHWQITYPAASRPAQWRRALHEHYLSEARADVGRWLPRYLPSLPRTPRQWRIRPLSSLWGSLSSAGNLSLDLALILAPPAAFEYVLVHELCHLIQANHSPAFWQEVENRFPDWREQRRWLREEGLAIKRQLHSLLQTD